MKQSRSSKFSAMSVQTECRTWKLVFKSYAEVPPDFAKQCQCKPNAELENLFSKVMLRCRLTSRSNVSANQMQSYESLLSRAMLRCRLTSRSNVSANRMQNLKTCFQKLCWGAAWLREAMSVQTECRTWKLVFKSYAEVPPDFAKQRYNIVTPKYKFLNYLISHLDIVEPKKSVWKAFI